MPWQERGFMLYKNEEPLVQRTCIKTASLQSEKLGTRKSVSEKGQSKKVQSEELSPVEKTSNEVLSKELKYKVPEELKLQTLICGHQVLTSLSDKSLVSICQNPNMRIQTVGYQPWSVDELRHDAAQIELCRRYRPLILHYTNRTGNREFREDLESYLWAILLVICGIGNENGYVIIVRFTFQTASPKMERSRLVWISSHLEKI